MSTTLNELLAAEIAPGVAHAICRELHGSTGYCVNCLSKARTIYAPATTEGFLVPTVAEWLRSEAVREVVAEAIPLGFTERDPYRDVHEAAAAALDAVAGLCEGEES